MDIQNRQSWLTSLYDATIQRRRSVKRSQQIEKSNAPVVGNTPYGLAALQNECRELSATPEGGRNQALNNAGFKIGQLIAAGKLRLDTASSELFLAATLTGLPDEEIKRTLGNALDAGMRFPRVLPDTSTHTCIRPQNHGEKDIDSSLSGEVPQPQGASAALSAQRATARVAPYHTRVGADGESFAGPPDVEDAPLYEASDASINGIVAQVNDEYGRGDGSASPAIPASPQARSGRLDEGGSIDPELLLYYERQGEYGDALLLASQISDTYVYDCTEKEWYLRTGHYYQKDKRSSLTRLVPGLLPAIYLDGASHFIQQAYNCRKANAEYGRDDPSRSPANPPSDNPEEQALLKKAKKLNERARLLTEVNRYRNIAFFTSALENMNLAGEGWDRDPWVIALDNCLLDLRTGLVRPWRSGDYFRTVCHTPWLGLETPAPRWLQALNDMFANLPLERRTAMIAYLQRVMGYALSGSCVEHKAILFYGSEGRNGKDTLIRAISEALGPYSSTVSKDVFLETGARYTPGSHSAHLLHLRHKRLAWANEPQGGGRLNIALIKELTGGGAITARGAYERDLVTFTPTHTLLINTNHLPRADAEEKALWERLHVIPFNMRFVEKPVGENERPRDMQLSEKLREEAAGILAWVVRGCLEWQRIGLSAPDEVMMAVKDYRNEQDTLQHFLDECCVRQEGGTVAANALYRCYDAWCRSGNLRPLNITNFGRMLGKKGIEKMHVMKGNAYRGIELLPTE